METLRTLMEQYLLGQSGAGIDTSRPLLGNRSTDTRTYQQYDRSNPVAQRQIGSSAAGVLAPNNPYRDLAEQAMLNNVNQGLQGMVGGLKVYHGSPVAGLTQLEPRKVSTISHFRTPEDAAGWVGAKYVYESDIPTGKMWDYNNVDDVKLLADYIESIRPSSYPGEVQEMLSLGRPAIVEKDLDWFRRNGYDTYTTNEMGADAIHQPNTKRQPTSFFGDAEQIRKALRDAYDAGRK